MKDFKKTVLRLLSSRKWLTSVAAAIVCTGVLVAGWNEASAQEIADKIVNVILILAGFYIGGNALEDAAAKIKTGRSG